MRHTFCSNWLAVHKDVNKLVLLSGHDSVDTMWRHYHRGTLESEATKFWDIRPPKTAENIVPFADHLGGALAQTIPNLKTMKTPRTMKTKSKKEVIFGAKRAGVTYLFKFDSRAAFTQAKAAAKQLGFNLATLLCADYRFTWAPELPKARKFTESDRKSSNMEIQISQCDDFTRRCLERQAAYCGLTVNDCLRDCLLCELQSDEGNSILDVETDEVILRGGDLGSYIGCHVQKSATELPPINFSRRPIPAGAIVETCT